MLGRILVKLLARAIAPSVRRKIRAFLEATHRPEEVQRELLRRILAYHADTDFGRDHGFRSVANAADYRRQVPHAPYEYVGPYIERVKKGQTGALLADPAVLMFA